MREAKIRKSWDEIWNVEAINTVDGTVLTVAVGCLSEEEAQEYADKKNRAEILGLLKFYIVKIK